MNTSHILLLSQYLYRIEVKEHYIVLYDGDCGFCNRTVAYVFKYEKNPQIIFASIQSNYTKELFEANDWPQPDLNTFYFIENGKKIEKSTAAMKVLGMLRQPYSWLRFFKIIPRFIRDAGYDFIAKRRARIAKSYCFVPSEEQRGRLKT